MIIFFQVSFETEKEIQMHVATHLMSEGNSGLECRLCLRVLSSPLQLQAHLIGTVTITFTENTEVFYSHH